MFAIIGSTFVNDGARTARTRTWCNACSPRPTSAVQPPFVDSFRAGGHSHLVHVFLAIGVLLVRLLSGHVPTPASPQSDQRDFLPITFSTSLPVGMRGLLLAGIFATAMGSLSTALNALATSFVRDWYLPYVNPDGQPSMGH